MQPTFHKAPNDRTKEDLILLPPSASIVVLFGLMLLLLLLLLLGWLLILVLLLLLLRLSVVVGRSLLHLGGHFEFVIGWKGVSRDDHGSPSRLQHLFRRQDDLFCGCRLFPCRLNLSLLLAKRSLFFESQLSSSIIRGIHSSGVCKSGRFLFLLNGLFNSSLVGLLLHFGLDLHLRGFG